MSDEVTVIVESDSAPEPPIDPMLMLIGALGSIDERLKTIETEMSLLNEFRMQMTQAIEAMSEHPMLKMLIKKKQ